jgi:hypothetical protein
MGASGSFPGVKRPGRKVDHSPPSSAEVKEWVKLYIHSPNTPSWRGAQLKHRDNFTFYTWNRGQACLASEVNKKKNRLKNSIQWKERKNLIVMTKQTLNNLHPCVQVSMTLANICAPKCFKMAQVYCRNSTLNIFCISFVCSCSTKCLRSTSAMSRSAYTLST